MALLKRGLCNVERALCADAEVYSMCGLFYGLKILLIDLYIVLVSFMENLGFLL